MSRELILGTAGHIDHGKTALVRAMTGIDTDRLPEEKQRGITIDIGFAHLEFEGFSLGIVDVPGHERFIRNMLAGASGIDVAMLVVAADDSVMPQTREHLAILELLGIQQGLVALTKCDLVEPSWLDLVEEEICELVMGTFLEDAPILRTSAVAGSGLSELKIALVNVCRQVSVGDPESVFRLAIDRSFVMPGRGTVITGTVWSGQVNTEDEVEWLPVGERVRLRGLQSHGQATSSVRRGQRAAVNIMGVHHSAIRRGHELATPGYLSPTRWLTVRLQVLDQSPIAIKHRSRVRLHIGTQEVIASVLLLTGTKVSSGGSADAQLFCASPVLASGGQPFVLRTESPLMTIGGGHILQAAARRIRRRDPETIQRLSDLCEGDEKRRAGAVIRFFGTQAWTDLDLAREARQSLVQVASLIDDLITERGVVELPISRHRTCRLHCEVLADLEACVTNTLRRLHDASPMTASIRRPSLIQRLDYLDAELLDRVVDRMVENGLLHGDVVAVALRDFKPKLTGAQQRLLETVIGAYKSAGLRPPDPDDLGDDPEIGSILGLCVSQGELAHIGGTLYLHSECELELRQRVTDKLRGSEGLTMSALRDFLGISRKYAIPFAEYLDRVGVTKRIGDVRVLADQTVT